MGYYCRCCGFKTLDIINSYDICEICLWEDDPFQRQNPFSDFGANHESLLNYQNRVLKKIPPKIKEFSLENGIKVTRNSDAFIIQYEDGTKNNENIDSYVKAFLDS